MNICFQSPKHLPNIMSFPYSDRYPVSFSFLSSVLFPSMLIFDYFPFFSHSLIPSSSSICSFPSIYSFQKSLIFYFWETMTELSLLARTVTRWPWAYRRASKLLPFVSMCLVSCAGEGSREGERRAFRSGKGRRREAKEGEVGAWDGKEDMGEEKEQRMRC